ncbi:MAG: LacI family DNA-binding transcriptional regulator [Lachnospiraceae bacterium]|nr:LacI family DNA-binding transcriptional regulator [Lachnospiraceae bacterium]
MSTVRDVASLAGVSVASVSRVLNHDTKYKMTQETRERVWKAVAELNYKAPTSSKQQMSIVKKNSNQKIPAVHRFGCVLNVRGGKYTDPYYLSILSGFEKTVMEKGYEIAFIRTTEELEDPQTLYNTFHEKISGVIIMNSLDDAIFNHLKEQTSFIVGIDTIHSSIDNIAYDHFTTATMAVKHLVDCGYKEIGFIGGFEDDLKQSRRFNGYYSALHRYGLPFNEKWVLPSNWDEKYCAGRIKKAYKEGCLPRAFFVASDLMAISVLRTLYDLGLNVPKDVAVMGLSNIEISKYSNPPLSTISLPIYEMGRVAANVLFERINGDDTPPKVINLGAEILKRSST